MSSPFFTQHPTDFALHLPIAGLRSAEDVRLDLDVALACTSPTRPASTASSRRWAETWARRA